MDGQNIKAGTKAISSLAKSRYHSSFELAACPYLKLEMTFGSLPYPELQSQSFVSQARKNRRKPKFPCVSPVETAADKLSGLT